MKKIAFYGKGGIGKTTTAVNMVAALMEKGHLISQISCDVKNANVDCVEISSICSRVKDNNSTECGQNIGSNEPIIVYDVIGDEICDVFSKSSDMRETTEIYIVSSGKLMSLCTANKIAEGIAKVAKYGQVRLAGIIGNSSNIPNEKEVLRHFATKLNTQLTTFIPYDRVVHQAVANRKTVLEWAPQSPQAHVYRHLANVVIENTKVVVPTPLSFIELTDIYLMVRNY